MTDYSRIFGTSKLFGLGYFMCGESTKCSICNCDISIDKKVCEPDCSYYVNYKTKTIEIFKKHSITYDDISTKSSTNNIIGGGMSFDFTRPRPITSSEESRNRVINILYKEGLELYPSNDLRKKILYHKTKWAVNSGHFDYGFFLMDPFSISEVEKFEKKFAELHALESFKLPSELRKYLLEVSREIFTYSYPVFFKLRQIKKYEDEEDEEESEKDKEGYEDFKDNTLIYDVGEGGCSFSQQINIMNGNIYNCDGDYNNLTDSFDKLVLNKLKY